MSSMILYPPIVDSYMPAFKAGSGDYKIYFSLSKFNGISDIAAVHAAITKQGSGINVVKKSSEVIVDEGTSIYIGRNTGVILNLPIHQVEGKNNLYYVNIGDENLTNGGWTAGWIYKIQLRFSEVIYDGSITGDQGQAAWLVNNASKFSEWSTICVIKTTGEIYYTIDSLDIDSRKRGRKSTYTSVYSSTLDLIGRIDNSADPSEKIKSYRFYLYDDNDILLEDTGEIYAGKFFDGNDFNYTLKTELQNEERYKLGFKFETNNQYIGGGYLDEKTDTDKRYTFQSIQVLLDPLDCTIISADTDYRGILDGVTSVHQEEEDGRIGIKLYDDSGQRYTGGICVRRSDSRTNFQIWDDIKVYSVQYQLLNDLDIFYDYTVESGIWYQYGVQSIDEDGNRSVLNKMTPIMRNFNYTFILGKNNQQLRLMFNNTMNSFRYQVAEGATDTIGGKYPIVSRNANTMYKTFPLNGMISFWMDENELFCTKKDIYTYDNIVEKYNNYNVNNGIMQYDYIYEKDFRQKVLDFLYDGEPKLFKSPTEGNLIVRITDVNCTPEQGLDRMLYSFSANAYEIMESTMANYESCGFYEVKYFENGFGVQWNKIGQIQTEIAVGDNIINKIYEKYNHNMNMGGYKETVDSISGLRITFEGLPLRLKLGNNYILGNRFSYNGTTFTVKDQEIRQYIFDDKITFTSADNISLLGDADGRVSSIPVTIDFVYSLTLSKYVEKEILTQSVSTGLSQLYNNYKAGTDLFREISYKYHIDNGKYFRKLNTITTVDIEAKPGIIIGVKDQMDSDLEMHEINSTGRLVFEDLSKFSGVTYVGYRNKAGEISLDNADILMNFNYVLLEGTYKREN